MKRLLLALPFVLMSGAAFAQTVPAEAHKQLWCGTALQLFIVLPPDATDAQKTEAQTYLDAAQKMLDDGTAGLVAAGFTAEAAEKVKTDLVPDVKTQISPGGTFEFTPQDCQALMAPPAAPPADASSAPADPSSSSAQ